MLILKQAAYAPFCLPSHNKGIDATRAACGYLRGPAPDLIPVGVVMSASMLTIAGPFSVCSSVSVSTLGRGPRLPLSAPVQRSIRIQAFSTLSVSDLVLVSN
jgi:hypothetical protein